MEIMVWSSFVDRGKSYSNLERRVSRKSISFYLLEDKSGPGSVALKSKLYMEAKGLKAFKCLKQRRDKNTSIEFEKQLTAEGGPEQWFSISPNYHNYLENF